MCLPCELLQNERLKKYKKYSVTKTYIGENLLHKFSFVETRLLMTAIFRNIHHKNINYDLTTKLPNQINKINEHYTRIV